MCRYERTRPVDRLECVYILHGCGEYDNVELYGHVCSTGCRIKFVCASLWHIVISVADVRDGHGRPVNEKRRSNCKPRKFLHKTRRYVYCIRRRMRRTLFAW